MSVDLQIMLVYLSVWLVTYISLLVSWVKNMSDSEGIFWSAIIALGWPLVILGESVVMPLRAIAYTVILIKDKIING